MQKPLFLLLTFILNVPISAHASTDAFNQFFSQPPAPVVDARNIRETSCCVVTEASDKPKYNVIAPSSTESSCFAVSGRLKRDVTAIRLIVEKSGNVVEDLWPRSTIDASGDRIFSTRLCLKAGAGAYKVRIKTSNQPAVNGNSYYLDFFDELSVENLDHRKFQQALYPSNKIQSDAPEIQLTAAAIIEGANTPEEKARAIHNWVAQNVNYDVDGYFAFVDGEKEKSYLNQPLDAVSVFHSKKSVCTGYARLTAALLRAVGIPAKVVSGVANYAPIEWTKDNSDPNSPYVHAWVEYDLTGNGNWQSMDTTWDAGNVDFKKRTYLREFTHTFFESEEFFKATHRKIDEYKND